MSLHVRTYEAEDPSVSDYIVILHGLFGSGDNWHAIAAKLREHAHVLLPDLPNHGQSLHTEEMGYELMAEAVAETLDARDVRQVHIMGHSMGGKVAMVFALRYPERVRSLLVVDIAPRTYPAYHQSIIEAMRQVPVADLTARNQADEYLAQGISERGVRAFLMKNLVKADDEPGYKWRINLPVIAKRYTSISSFPEIDGSYSGPVLFVAGGTSPYLHGIEPGDLKGLFPEAEVETIPAAGHWVHAEARERFLSSVISFISQHGERAVEHSDD